MKFLTGLLAGLLLGGPAVTENHYHITETTRMRFEPNPKFSALLAKNWSSRTEVSRF